MLVTLAGLFVIACGSALAIPLGCWVPSPTPPELCLNVSVLPVLVLGQSLSCVSLACVSYWCLCSVCTRRSVLASSSCPGCRGGSHVSHEDVRLGGSKPVPVLGPCQGRVRWPVWGLCCPPRPLRGWCPCGGGSRVYTQPIPPLHQAVQVHFLCCQ